MEEIKQLRALVVQYRNISEDAAKTVKEAQANTREAQDIAQKAIESYAEVSAHYRQVSEWYDEQAGEMYRLVKDYEQAHIFAMGYNAPNEDN